ncbi:MAG TPA: cupin domain-containing protein [Pseudorhodoplanes sp.]|jgi:quercetin dioxygenase-like cupin family protein|nr:cupin domain-containing protein [Pseudorhodoplanes sp.]
MPALKGFSSLSAIPTEQINDKTARKFISGEQGMLVWWSGKAGSVFAPHSHPHEQIVWMLKGKLRIRIGDEEKVMVPGDVAVIPGGVEHAGSYVEDCEILDVFAPPREDFLDGVPPSYIKQD